MSVDEKHFTECLIKLRDLRLWAVINKIDPWAFRQTLIIALEMDTKVALERGIKQCDLQKFDFTAKKDAQLWVELLATATKC